MSIVAEFTIPADALPGGNILVEMPEIRVELERVVPTHESTLPFFWVWGPDPERFVERSRQESDMGETKLLDRVDGGALFRTQWSPDAEIIEGIKKLNATLIEATGTAENWRFQIRTQERSAFTAFRSIFEDEGIPVELSRIYDLEDLVDESHSALTDEQRETLLFAYREGYFGNPRETTQVELGEHFGISHRAVSERLRRGMRNLVSATLLPDGDRP